ncbi:phage holin [Paenalkalicoccus suaedae]|uniref:Phage holin n=1 Tax=Paenalkalicoccus suaedae TaxID=2592382 RepID=A0A859FBW8_9BACI|nr:phage holin [Paenalkalicoccus suaedae]QKS70272.1 phage holin [Paenalkalicoccus suaedae]
MKINWKVRFKNPQFVTQLVLSIFVPILAYFGLTAQDLTTWSALGSLIVDALLNPYVLILVVMSVYNALNDPTVRGLGDSRQALKYEKPREDK